jgi:hypothetical protein
LFDYCVCIDLAKYQLICVGNAEFMTKLTNTNASTVQRLASDAMERNCVQLPGSHLEKHNSQRNKERFSDNKQSKPARKNSLSNHSVSSSGEQSSSERPTGKQARKNATPDATPGDSAAPVKSERREDTSLAQTGKQVKRARKESESEGNVREAVPVPDSDSALAIKMERSEEASFSSKQANEARKNASSIIDLTIDDSDSDTTPDQVIRIKSERREAPPVAMDIKSSDSESSDEEAVVNPSSYNRCAASHSDNAAQVKSERSEDSFGQTTKRARKDDSAGNAQEAVPAPVDDSATSIKMERSEEASLSSKQSNRPRKNSSSTIDDSATIPPDQVIKIKSERREAPPVAMDIQSSYSESSDEEAFLNPSNPSSFDRYAESVSDNVSDSKISDEELPHYIDEI